MGQYLKLFQTHSDYNTYINGQNAVLPNVSYCEDQNEVHYNPWVETRLITTFNLLDATQPVMLGFINTEAMYDSWDNITKVEVTPPSGNIFELTVSDLTLQPSGFNNDVQFYVYTFDETGDYTLKYTLVDPTIIKSSMFEGNGITSITIPKCVTTIEEAAFQHCRLLTSIEIPDNVTLIDTNAFSDCDDVHIVRIGSGITYIGNEAFYSDFAENREYYIYATTPPEIDYPFDTPSYTIYVPAESVNAYKAANGWSTYASAIEAIPTT